MPQNCVFKQSCNFEASSEQTRPWNLLCEKYATLVMAVVVIAAVIAVVIMVENMVVVMWQLLWPHCCHYKVICLAT